MKEPLKIRCARKEEFPTMARLSVAAFRHSGRQVNAALFPEHLRVNPGDSDEVKLSVGDMHRNSEKNNHHFIVVADEQDIIMGWADWICGEDPVLDMTQEQREIKRAERIARLPRSMDLQAAQRLGREAGELSKRLREALGEDQYQNSWSRPNPTLVMEQSLSWAKS